MVFSSVIFVFMFLPLVIVAYLLLLAHVRRASMGLWLCNLLLFMASMLFYAWGEPRYVLLLLASALINFHVGLLLSPHERLSASCSWLRPLCLTGGICINLGLLGYFKYMGFFISSGGLGALNAILPTAWAVQGLTAVALPLGISFYTFQGLSYLLDVYRGHVAASRSLVNFGCYLCMFPQLVAGPIVRYASIERELVGRRLSSEQFTGGVTRFIMGLAKKVLIADTLGRVADAAFAIPVQELSALAAWAGIVCYTLQIYYDFSGYSDMAIGMGAMFGFTFPENFNYPYISRSIREFWQRWHMTLSTWFRDYLYIPLGGSRHGLLRTAFNLWLVFVLCGIWHGASWMFVAWGVWHGLFLALERVFPRLTDSMPRAVQHLYTVTVFMGGWIIFRAQDAAQAWGYVRALGGAHDMGVQTNRVWMELFAGDVYLALFIGIMLAMPVLPWLRAQLAQRIPEASWGMVGVDVAARTGLLILFGLCTMPLFGATYNAFIYFRF